MSDLVPQQQAALQQHVNAVDAFGRQKISRSTVRHARHEIEESLIGQIKIERAKQAAISGMLAENQARQLATALSGDNPNALMAADDYIRALHAAGVNQVLKAGS